MSVDNLIRRLGAPSPVIDRPSRRFRMPGRLFYAANHSMPFSSNGYAVRTHGVASGLVLLRAWDIPGFNHVGYATSHHLDCIRYAHTFTFSDRNMALHAHLAKAVECMVES